MAEVWRRAAPAWAALFLIIAPAARAPGTVPTPAPTRAHVVVLATGGTIAGTGAGSSPVGYSAAKVGVDALLAALPQLDTLARVSGRQVLQLPSQNLRPDHWLTIAQRAQAALDAPDVDGVVITHGTDTLEESAYFLHLVLKSDKPVVVVGAMRPVTALSADGPFNLYEAVNVAAHPQARGRGVLVLLEDAIHTARDVTKAHTSRPDAFRAPDAGALGALSGDQIYFYRAPTRRHTLGSALDVRGASALPPVEVALAYAGASGAAIDALVAGGARGIVLAGVGNGNFGDEVGRALDRARRGGVAVVRASRVGSGVVARNDEVDDDRHRFVTADNLLPQKARVLLMLGLLAGREGAALQELFDSH